jgi:hypothetical protein
VTLEQLQVRTSGNWRKYPPDLLPRGIDVTEVYHGPGSPFFPAARIPGPDPERASYNSYASFEDPDGNGWTLQEITTRLPGREPEE